MSFQVFRASALAAACIFVATAASANGHRHFAPKSTLTVTLDGTLGPIISGDDPAGLDGKSATVKVKASESLNPYKTTATSASYHIPAGDIVVTVDGTNYKSDATSSMIVKLGKKADTLTLQASVDYEGVKVDMTDVSSLASGSWTKSVLQHPAPFSPSPQDLTEPSSNFTYTAFGDKTKLGVTGTAANKD